MRLNETLGELNNNNFVEFGEGKYWITIMGTPSPTEPWGWQLDGHHLVINFFVLGSQIVATPSFWGSEPAVATSGKYAGTRIMDDEMYKGLELLHSLNFAQQAAAVLTMDLDSTTNLRRAEAAGVDRGRVARAVAKLRSPQASVQEAGLRELQALDAAYEAGQPTG